MGYSIPSSQRSPWQFEDCRSSPRHWIFAEKARVSWLQALRRCRWQSWLQADQGLHRDQVPARGAVKSKVTLFALLSGSLWVWQDKSCSHHFEAVRLKTYYRFSPFYARSQEETFPNLVMREHDQNIYPTRKIWKLECGICVQAQCVQ